MRRNKYDRFRCSSRVYSFYAIWIMPTKEVFISNKTVGKIRNKRLLKTNLLEIESKIFFGFSSFSSWNSTDIRRKLSVGLQRASLI